MDKSEISKYRGTLFSISEELSEKEVRKLMYLCKDKTTVSQREGIKDALSLFDILEKNGTISEDDFTFLIKRMEDLKRYDLKRKFQAIMPDCDPEMTATRPQYHEDSRPKPDDKTSQTPYTSKATPGKERAQSTQRGITINNSPVSLGTSVGNVYYYGSEKSSSAVTPQRHHKRRDPNIRVDNTNFQDTRSSPSTKQGTTFSQCSPKSGTLKTPADFYPTTPPQTKPDVTLPVNRQDVNINFCPETPSKNQASNPDPFSSPERACNKKETPILDWPIIWTPKKLEIPQDDENSSLIKAVYNTDGTPRIEKTLKSMQSTREETGEFQSSGREVSGQHGHKDSTCMSEFNDQSSGDCSDNLETDAPQVLKESVVDASQTSAPKPASLLSQDGASPNSEVVPMQDVEDTPSQGTSISETHHDATKSAEHDGNVIGEVVSTAEMLGQVPLRDYQHELAHYPLTTRGNYIICAPTGSGKTLTAASICYKNYTKFQAGASPGKHFKALFIVNLRHLTQQQSKAFQEHFPDKQAVRKLSEQQPIEYALMKDEAMPVVLMLTAQIFVNALRQKTVTLQDLQMLIFDECHHTDLLHPYNVIMKAYLKQKTLLSQGVGGHTGCLPQVIGLSASLGVGHGQWALGHVLKLCANMDARDVIRVHKHKEQLGDFVKAPEQDAIISVPRRVTTERHFGGVLEEIMSQIEDQLGDSAKSSLPRHGCQPYENEVIERQEKSSQHDNIIVYMYLDIYNRALMLYEDLPVQDCLQIVEDFHDNRSLDQNQEDTSREEYCRQLFHTNIKEMKRMAGQEGDDGNQKLQELIKLLANQFAQNPSSKGIILTRMKVSTVALCEFIRSAKLLKQLECPIKPERLVGQGAFGDQCMTESEQKMILESFRQEDGCNVLVATDIAQEGLDMPACNFVIRYNFVSNEIGTVQSKGRARAEGSQCYLIVESDSVNEKRELENRDKVKRMEEAMIELEAMGEDERLAGIKKTQEEIIAAMLEAETQEQQQATQMKTEEIILKCAECKLPICKASDLRRKGLGGFVTCVDPTFKERVVEEFREKGERYRDTQSVGKIMCGNFPKCKNQLGTKEDFFLQSTREGFCLTAKHFIVEFPTGGSKKLKQWKQLPVPIKEGDDL